MTEWFRFLYGDGVRMKPGRRIRRGQDGVLKWGDTDILLSKAVKRDVRGSSHRGD